MAWLAYVGYALSAYGAYEQGQSSARSARQMAQERMFEAAQNEERAKLEVAASQRAAMNEERQTKLVQSTVTARAQGGAGDPTVVDILSDLAAEGSYRSAVALYEGQARARQARMGAEAARYEAAGYRAAGYDAEQAGNIAAASTIFSAAAQGYQRGDFRRSKASTESIQGKYGTMPKSNYELYEPGTKLYPRGFRTWDIRRGTEEWDEMEANRSSFFNGRYN